MNWVVWGEKARIFKKTERQRVRYINANWALTFFAPKFSTDENAFITSVTLCFF